MDGTWLPYFWAVLIAFSIIVYVILDGFDLGVGILFGTTRDESCARHHDERDRTLLGRQRNLADPDRC